MASLQVIHFIYLFSLDIVLNAYYCERIIPIYPPTVCLTITKNCFLSREYKLFYSDKSCKRVFISGNATCRCSENKGLIKNLFHSINTVIHVSPEWPRDWPWRQIFHSSLLSRLRDVHAKMSLKLLFYAKLQFNYTYPIAESVEVQSGSRYMNAALH